MTPLVLDITRKLRRDPVPYLLAVAMASNAGSVATLTGNPQNMIIGVASHIPYAHFAMRLVADRGHGAALTFCLIAALHRTEFSTAFFSVNAREGSRRHPRQIAKATSVTIFVVAAFFAGAPVAEAAMIGGSLFSSSRAVKPEKFMPKSTALLLLMFAGLFIVVAGAQKALLTPEALAAVGRLRLDDGLVLVRRHGRALQSRQQCPGGAGSEPFVAALPHPDKAWLVVAMSSTLAGNLTLVGSIANLIVAERAKRADVTVSFLDYLKVGLPLTLISSPFGVWPLVA